MAGSSFFALLDDIATIMDDVAILSKVSAQKTSAVLGDDLALNSQQLIGLTANREFPVVYAVAKGSLLNKIIIVPCALLISFLLPGLIMPLLMLGGLFLCYEGMEKIFHSFISHSKVDSKLHEIQLKELLNTSIDLVKLEKEKIKGAVRTDFILSAEIIVISLGIVASSPLLTQCLVLTAISFFMTIGVYGSVAIIVKLDDLGLYLLEKPKCSWMGKFLLLFAPKLMKFLSIAGTIAMFLVGGGIIVHGIPIFHHFFESIEMTNSFIRLLVTSVGEGLVGAVFGSFVLVGIKFVKNLKKYWKRI